jgi:predicted transcriptional regulator
MTELERRILTALVAFPGERDAHLADRLDIPRSSFSAARKRLLQRGVFREIYVPDFLELGYEILFISYVLFSAAAEANIKRNSWKHVKGRHRHFLTMSDSSKLLTMFAARNYTEVVHRTDIFELHYARHGFLEQHRREYLYFPLRLSGIHTFYDFAPLLRGEWEEMYGNEGMKESKAKMDLPAAAKPNSGTETGRPMVHPGIETQGSIHQVSIPSLSAGESRMLKALLENPSMRPGRLGAITGTGRTTADRMMKGLMERGLVSRKVMVSPWAAGWEHIGAFRLRFRPASTMSDRENLTRQVLGLHPIFFIERKKEAFLIFLSRDFRQMNGIASELQRIYDNAGALEESPASLYFMEGELKYSVWDDFSSNLFTSGADGHPSQ